MVGSSWFFAIALLSLTMINSDGWSTTSCLVNTDEVGWEELEEKGNPCQVRCSNAQTIMVFMMMFV